jgi:hypothetical protein
MISTNSNKDSASDDLIDYSDDETAGEHSEAGKFTVSVKNHCKLDELADITAF